MQTQWGIDDLNLYASTLAVDFPSLAAARGIGENAYRHLQLSRRSVTPCWEDQVTMAVNAARPLIGDNPDAFGLLIVATESGLDYGKPISTYIHKALGLGSRCRNFEIKHACYGGTAALQMALSWARGAGTDRKALVIMSDQARRHFNDPAEMTAGSGAVALTVGAAPRVFAVDPESGYATREVYDVARPTATTEYGNAVLSLGSYLDLLELCWQDYARVAGAAALHEQFRYMLYHTPLVSLIERAHGVLLDMGDEMMEPEQITASFDRMVRPSLGYCREVGNVYAGSLYTALAGLIDHVPESAGARVGLFSYGSGACAELFAGTVMPTAKATIGRHRIGDTLAARRSISVLEYEALTRAGEDSTTQAEYHPDRSTPDGLFETAYQGRGRLVLDAVRNHYRQYSYS